MQQAPPTFPNTNYRMPWDSMGLSSRLSCIMNIFPRHLWGYIITEPIFTPEEMYEVDAYFGYARRFMNLQPRTYWNYYSQPLQPSCDQPVNMGVLPQYNWALPQMSFVHNVVTSHNIHVVAHEYTTDDPKVPHATSSASKPPGFPETMSARSITPNKSTHKRKGEEPLSTSPEKYTGSKRLKVEISDIVEHDEEDSKGNTKSFAVGVA